MNRRYIVGCIYNSGDPVDYAATDDIKEALQCATRLCFQIGVKDVQIHDVENPDIVLICEPVE